jgi:hypothetical protein
MLDRPGRNSLFSGHSGFPTSVGLTRNPASQHNGKDEPNRNEEYDCSKIQQTSEIHDRSLSCSDLPRQRACVIPVNSGRFTHTSTAGGDTPDFVPQGALRAVYTSLYHSTAVPVPGQGHACVGIDWRVRTRLSAP